jgi:hypothetical protein
MFSKMLAFISVLFLVYQFLYPYYKLAGRKHKTRIRQYTKDKKAAKLKRERREKKLNFARKYAVRLPFMQSEAQLQKTLDRLGLDKYPEEIWLEQNLILVGGALFCLLAFSANTLVGFGSAFLVPLVFFVPTDELDKEVRRKNRNIALEFPLFYSMVFYQYSKSINIYLADVIQDYLPNASSDMAEELGVMIQNIEYADEEYALKQLKKRVPIHHIIRFCDIMETRLRGYDNIAQMQYLKNEIDQYRIKELENELNSRVMKNNAIQFVLIAILVLYVVIYYVFTILASMDMFM